MKQTPLEKKLGINKPVRKKVKLSAKQQVIADARRAASGLLAQAQQEAEQLMMDAGSECKALDIAAGIEPKKFDPKMIVSMLDAIGAFDNVILGMTHKEALDLLAQGKPINWLSEAAQVERRYDQAHSLKALSKVSDESKVVLCDMDTKGIFKEKQIMAATTLSTAAKELFQQRKLNDYMNGQAARIEVLEAGQVNLQEQLNDKQDKPEIHWHIEARALLASGSTQQQVANLVGKSLKTLQRFVKSEKGA